VGDVMAQFDCKNGDTGLVISRLTGERVIDVVRGDDAADWFDQLVRDKLGKIVVDTKTHGIKTRRCRIPIIFIRTFKPSKPSKE
jgi:hypothetical protein